MEVWTTQQAGPASYPTGGIVVATDLTTVEAGYCTVDTPGSNLKSFEVVASRSGANLTLKLMKRRYDKLASIGDMSGLPASVSAASSSGQVVASESSHTHSMTHGHTISGNSGTLTGGSGQVTQGVTGNVNTSTHTHTATIGSAAFTTGAGSSHNHTWDNIYQHQHSATLTATDGTLVELANGTDLSGATINIYAVGS